MSSPRVPPFASLGGGTSAPNARAVSAGSLREGLLFADIELRNIGPAEQVALIRFDPGDLGLAVRPVLRKKWSATSLQWEVWH